LAIPGNDESTICSIFYNDLISNYVLLRKYTVVLMWFVNIRSVSRILEFSSWLKNYYLYTKKSLNHFRDFSSFIPSNIDNLSKGLGIFFSKNLASELTFGQLDIFAGSIFVEILQSSIDSLFRRRLLLQKLLRTTLVKKMIARKKTVFRKKILKFSKLREKYLKSSFFGKYLSTSISKFVAGRYSTFKIFLGSVFFYKKGFF